MLFYSYFKTLVGKEVSIDMATSCSAASPVLIREPGLQVTVELKNDLAIQGTLHSVDQYLNIKLHNTRVVNEQKYPHMVRDQQQSSCNSTTSPLHGMVQMSVRNCFIRGSVVRYVQVSF